ncbi:MAG: DUF3662 domain-containing protein [Acidimicrobiia bacterium]|nr:DUF3662 domain-containing protein [Acidimicrobiia bacterium]
MALQGFERRLERLVEGVFSKTFSSRVQPVEIGRAIIRRLETQRTITTQGATVPNNITVHLSNKDVEQLDGILGNLADELCIIVRDHANSENYRLVGPINVTLISDSSVDPGQIEIKTAFDQGRGANKGVLLGPNDEKIELSNETTTVGRLTTCGVSLTDSRVSRLHAEIIKNAEGYELIDKGSTNGTQVNGETIASHTLVIGDKITFGNTTFEFQAHE